MYLADDNETHGMRDDRYLSIQDTEFHGVIGMPHLRRMGMHSTVMMAVDL